MPEGIGSYVLQTCPKCHAPVRVNAMQVGRGPVTVKCQKCWVALEIKNGKLAISEDG